MTRSSPADTLDPQAALDMLRVTGNWAAYSRLLAEIVRVRGATAIVERDPVPDHVAARIAVHRFLHEPHRIA